MAKYSWSFTVVNGTLISAGWESFLMRVAVCKIVQFIVKCEV